VTVALRMASIPFKKGLEGCHYKPGMSERYALALNARISECIAQDVGAGRKKSED
jgi:hypothetical protein